MFPQWLVERSPWLVILATFERSNAIPRIFLAAAASSQVYLALSSDVAQTPNAQQRCNQGLR